MNILRKHIKVHIIDNNIGNIFKKQCMISFSNIYNIFIISFYGFKELARLSIKSIEGFVDLIFEDITDC